MTPELLERAEALLNLAQANDRMIATAESCTGGLIAATLTEIAGSSAVVDRGFVTYSNEAKQDMLGVPITLIASHGAVSEPVARAMADGALARSEADLAISVTGVAGPSGGSPDKPVGTVHFGLARRGGLTLHDHKVFDDARAHVRTLTVAHALTMLVNALKSEVSGGG
ncbi:MAG: CinA family protein [Pseudomonadota bacterium]